MSENKLPKIQDLYADVELAKSTDLLMALLNQKPKEEWIKTHPYIRGYRYLPIDKIEFLLKKIFKQYRIEVLREGVAFNGVYVVVRVWYLHPITNVWDYHDGVGAKELQVKSGASAADLSMINPGALAMAFPIAKTVAIKDACDHFGSLFGSDINRKDVMTIAPDETLQSKSSPIDKINAIAEQTKVESIDVTFEQVSAPASAPDIEVRFEHVPSATPAMQSPPAHSAPPPPTDDDDDF